MMGKMVVQYLKRCSVDGGMKTCVVPELNQGEPFEPLSWAGVNEAAEKRLQTLVDAIHLTVYLGVVS